MRMRGGLLLGTALAEKFRSPPKTPSDRFTLLNSIFKKKKKKKKEKSNIIDMSAQGVV